MMNNDRPLFGSVCGQDASCVRRPCFGGDICSILVEIARRLGDMGVEPLEKMTFLVGRLVGS